MHARLGAGLIAALLVLSTSVAIPRPAEARAAAGETDAGSQEAPAGAQLGTFCESFCTLYVELGGNGSGRWKTTNNSGVPDGRIDCHYVNGVKDEGSTCSGFYGAADAPHTVSFLMTPDPGSEACDNDGCDSSYESFFTVSATITWSVNEFRLIPYPLEVTKGGTGTGDVFTTPAGISCGSTCTKLWDFGTSILLTAIPTQGSTFAGWTGSCTGQPADCLIAIIGPLTTEALFNGTAATAKPTKGPTPTQAGATAAVATAPPTIPPATSAPAATGALPTPTGAPGAATAIPSAAPTVPASDGGAT